MALFSGDAAGQFRVTGGAEMSQRARVGRRGPKSTGRGAAGSRATGAQTKRMPPVAPVGKKWANLIENIIK